MNWKDLTNNQKIGSVIAVIAVAVLIILIVWYFVGFTSTVDESTTGKAMKGQALKSSSSNVLIPKFLSSDDNGNLSLFDLDKHTTENDFSAKSLSTPGKVTGGQLCIGSTCIDESQLKQLIRSEVSTQKKPSDYYNLPTDSSLIYEEPQNVATIGWSTVKTIIPHTRSHRIVQYAYRIASDSSNLPIVTQKMFTRYSLGNKEGIKNDATKDAWSEWNADILVGNATNDNTWIISNKTDTHLRMYRNGSSNNLTDAMFNVHNDGTTVPWINNKPILVDDGRVIIRSGDPVDLHAGGYVLSSRNGNFDPDSYATYRGQDASDAFIIKKKNTTGRIREDAKK